MYILILQRIAVDFVLHLVYFPIWWYTAGARRALLWCWEMIKYVNSYMAPGLWLKNIFVPMFGQRDWQGRIVSFMMRTFNIIGRSIGLFLFLIIDIILFFVWIVFPIFVVFMLVTAILPAS